MCNLSFTNHEKNTLIQIARNALLSAYNTEYLTLTPTKNHSGNLNHKCGVFISLYNKSTLRGCLGRFSANSTLIDLVKEMTLSAALYDHRFKPLKKEELCDICIEISVLTPLVRIYSIDEICLGKHGIYIKKGDRSGTFLPQVAEKTNWDVETFLGHCSRDKAGIGWNGWKNAELFVFEAIIINENQMKQLFH